MSKVEKFKTALQEAEQEHKREQDRVRKAREDLEKVQARLGEVDPDNATEFQRFTSERTIATDRLESFGLRERIASEKVERAKQALAEAVAAERVAAAKAARQLVARAAVHLSALVLQPESSVTYQAAFWRCWSSRSLQSSRRRSSRVNFQRKGSATRS